MSYKIVETKRYGMPCYEVHKDGEVKKQFRNKVQAVKFINAQGDEQ